jgi:hypothetical protein
MPMGIRFAIPLAASGHGHCPGLNTAVASRLVGELVRFARFGEERG